LRILVINKFLYPKGGSETYMFNLSQYLEDQGHEIEYFGMEDDKNIVSNRLNKHVKNVSFKGSALTKVTYPFKCIYSFEARRKLRTVLQSFKPDIVHINNYNFQITPSILYEIKKHNVPVVQTLHDPQLVCPYHRLYNYQKNEICEKCKGGKFYHCIKEKCIDNSFAKSFIGTLESYLYRTLGTYNLIDYYISPSRFLKNKLFEMGLTLDQNKIIVLHNFIDKISDAKALTKKNYVIYFGRLSSEKGIEVLVRAIKQLPDIPFLIVGQGDVDIRWEDLRNAEYVGFKTGDELNTLISQALASVCPSEWYENCPMSILESQMLGTPVIGADNGGIPELIEHEKDGLLFEPGNAEDLAGKIRSLYENRELLEQYTVNCLEKMKKFTIESYYIELMKIYDQAIKKHERVG